MFSVPQIAQLLRVSKRTIRRRMSQFGLSIRSTYSQLSDDQLDEVVCAIQQQFLYSGNRQMYGHLVSRGIRVQYHRVRESQSRIDPEGKTLKQRTYSVEVPQHLWHIDGNHKLIRYKSFLAITQLVITTFIIETLNKLATCTLYIRAAYITHLTFCM